MADGDLWRDRNKVFVAGLPAHVDDNALAEKFRPFGEMFQSKVVYDSATGKSKGFGFITFSDYANALEAVSNVNQQKWDNRILNVRFLKPKADATGSGQTGAAPMAQQRRPTKVVGPCPPGCVSMYVGNLAYSITEQVLRKVFEKCGDIKAVRFAEHMHTKEFRGFGHVQFYETSSCEKAIALDGTIVMGRPMNIDYGSRDEATEKVREDMERKLKKGVCHKFQSGECTRGDDCKFAHIPPTTANESAVVAAPPIVSRYAPPPSQVPVPAATASASSASSSDVPVCLSFQKGKCKRGDACKFQHVEASVVATQPPSAFVVDTSGDVDMETAPGQGDDDEQTPICMSFQQGKCKRGEKCRFRHTTAVAAPAPAARAPVQVAAPQYTPRESRARAPAVAAVQQPEEPICLNYQKGTCKRGDSCRFRHVEASAVPEPVAATVPVSVSMAPASRAPVPVAVPVQVPSVAADTQADHDSPICQNFLKGKCKRGAACRFRHVDASSIVPDAPVIVPTISICQNFLRGRCMRGTSCRFAHTVEGDNEEEDAFTSEVTAATAVAVPADAAVSTAHSDYQKRFQSICYNWQNTKTCARGDQCPFFHDGAAVAKTPTPTTTQEEERQPKKEKKSKKRKVEDEDSDDDKKVKKAKKAKKDKKSKKAAKVSSDSDSE